MEIYTDKAQNKVIIVTDEQGLEDLRAACISYSCEWTKKSKEETDEVKRENDEHIAKEYSDYYLKFYDAGKPFREEE